MMIADQVIALNRAREVAGAASCALKGEKKDCESKMSTVAATASVVVAGSQSKRISFSVDSLLSDVHQRQTHAADLSMRSTAAAAAAAAAAAVAASVEHQRRVTSDNASSEDEKSFIDSDIDEDNEDVDIEDDCDVSETSDATPSGKMSSDDAYIAAAAAAAASISALNSNFNAHNATSLTSNLHMPNLANLPNLAMQMRPALGAPFPGGVPPPGWPLPYGIAAAAWAQHASQFVTSKSSLFSNKLHPVFIYTRS